MNKVEDDVIDALKDEVQMWRENMKFAIRDVPLKKVSDEALWVNVMSLLTIGKSGAGALYPDTAEDVIKRLAIPIFILETASSGFAKLYKQGAALTNQNLEKQYLDIRASYTNKIDDAERNFYSSFVGKQVIAKFIELFSADKQESREIVRITRKVLAASQVIPTDSRTLTRWANTAFAKVYERVQTLFLHSSLHKPNLSDIGRTRPGKVYIKVNDSNAKIRSFKNIGQLKEICLSRNLGWTSLDGFFGAPKCYELIQGYVVESEKDFIYLLSNAWMYKLKIQKKSHIGSLSPFSPYRLPVTFSNLEIKPIPVSSERSLPIIMQKTLPSTLKKIEETYEKLKKQSFA